jgi:hypothetical protein
MAEILLTSKRQRELLKKLKLANFDMSYNTAVADMNMPLSSIYQSWKSILKNNRVEIVININGEEVMRKQMVKDEN